MADASFKAEFLKAHNDYRAKHGVPALALSESLSQAAQAWAEHLGSINKNRSKISLEHSKGEIGENLFCCSSSDEIKLTGKEAVESWYNEIKDYSFSKPGYGMNTAHFTQVVWKSSTEVGVGLAHMGGAVFVVGQYTPPGNLDDPKHFEENVLPAA